MALSSPASIPNLDGSNKEILALDVVRSQMNDMRKMMEMLMMEGRKNTNRRGSIAAIEYERIINKLDKLENSKIKDLDIAREEYQRLMRETEEIMMNCDNEGDHRMFKYLIERIYRQRENIELL